MEIKAAQDMEERLAALENEVKAFVETADQRRRGRTISQSSGPKKARDKDHLPEAMAVTPGSGALEYERAVDRANKRLRAERESATDSK